MNFEEFFKRSISALNESGVNYVIVGGVLVSIYGEPRATKDIDVIVDLAPEDTELINRFLGAMRKRMKIFGLDTWVECLEALIVAKLSIYYSDQSVKDVKSMVELNRDVIDRELLYSIADKIGVRRRVENILKELGLS